MKDVRVFIKEINELFADVKNLLPDEDMKNIVDFINNNEFGLAYETLCTQIYEYNIKITSDFYRRISHLGELIGFDQSEWLSLKELINNHQH